MKCRSIDAVMSAYVMSGIAERGGTPVRQPPFSLRTQLACSTTMPLTSALRLLNCPPVSYPPLHSLNADVEVAAAAAAAPIRAPSQRSPHVRIPRLSSRALPRCAIAVVSFPFSALPGLVLHRHISLPLASLASPPPFTAATA